MNVWICRSEPKQRRPTYAEPLLSLKVSECSDLELVALERRLTMLLAQRPLRVFLHAYTDTPLERRLLDLAAAVYCGNPEVASQVVNRRPDAAELWCPATITVQDRFEPVELSVFSFGMAHKVRADYYARLRELLDAVGPA